MQMCPLQLRTILEARGPMQSKVVCICLQHVWVTWLLQDVEEDLGDLGTTERRAKEEADAAETEWEAAQLQPNKKVNQRVCSRDSHTHQWWWWRFTWGET